MASFQMSRGSDDLVTDVMSDWFATHSTGSANEGLDVRSSFMLQINLVKGPRTDVDAGRHPQVGFTSDVGVFYLFGLVVITLGNYSPSPCNKGQFPNRVLTFVLHNSCFYFFLR